MVSRSALLANAATAGFFGLLLFGVFHITAEQRCNADDGKWASSTGTCVTRACFQSGTCGTWAYPAERCARLKKGAARAEVYFQLGNPARADADEAIWHADKASSDLIVASFQGGTLRSLACPGQP